MLAIISNIKFCYKFFQEENFEQLSDSDFARFEESLESTERLIETSKRLLMMRLLNETGETAKTALNESLENLERLSSLVGQFWAQELTADFGVQLERASR